MNILTEGQKAPDFKVADQDGNQVSLKDFQGKTVVLYFYPKDNTPGCTAEACDFRDNYAGLVSKGIAVLGVSTDPELSHQKFAAKYQLPFPLLADTDQQLVQAYGVWGEKNMYGKKYMGINRTTFIISGDGTIAHIIQKVDTKNATAQVLALLDQPAGA
ncbi:thioredoxin-dependent thiol peroxidase [Pedobacter antarcticus]|uniref:thioredoxin-dependent peroxiredoxin n=2 Tax=Pedobacter antarcticus TaxID=34086 RepID=A0A081PI95_9SPHI|nr:thioredoxin-dependent thiol peroxidase [Pedobacter antarcticus]KEQ30418.1 thiol peroxidase [Pedobacter antarcticus 4BY]SDM07623.1 peroxiredoxin Q/BCP [Pedobacter antarcticus]SFF41841.1 peroxiredoxin Q/BCP [Pedobacter antarcticus]